MRDHYLQLWRYTGWANDRLLDAVRTHGGTEDRKTLNHIAAAQSIWLARLDLAYTSVFGLFDDHPLPMCAEELQRGVTGWIRYLEAQQDTTLVAVIHFATLRGDLWQHRQRDIIAHAINHGTHHRGQIALRLRQAGHAPPATDYIVWLRELETA